MKAAKTKHTKAVLGIDLGTSGCKITVVSSAGEFLHSASASYPTYCPQPAWAEQEPREWLQALTEGTRRLLSEVGLTGQELEIAGLALSSAAHIGVLMDRNDQPLRRAILWSDQRTTAEVQFLENQCGQEILERTYQKVSTTWTLPHLLWLRNNEPVVWGKKARIVLSKDFVLQWLTGRFVTDPATAVSAQLYDVVERNWSRNLCSLLEIGVEELPRVIGPTEVAGRLREEAAQALNLPAGIPVVTGTLDSASETFASGVIHPGQCLVRLATAGGVHVVLAKPKPQTQLITYPHPIAPLWYCQAGTSSCASAVSWAVSNFSFGQPLSFDAWDDAASGVAAGAEGLIFHPYLMGERCPHWDPFLRASFVGATLKHTTGHFARAVYEGTAFSIRDAMSVLGDTPVSGGPITAVGGGTRSGLWLRILADVLGKPVHAASRVDSSLGAALLALMGLRFMTIDDLTAKTSVTQRFVPSEAAAKIYDEQFGTYRRIHQQLAPVYHDQGMR